MRCDGVQRRNFIRTCGCHTKGQISDARLQFICWPYAAPAGDVSNSYVAAPSYLARREAMLDLALFFGFALLCAYITYERLCNRW